MSRPDWIYGPDGVLAKPERWGVDVSQTWPAGVIARYLTVGGATVDITQRPRFTDDDRLLDAIATCTGCNAKERIGDIDLDSGIDAERILERNTTTARTWAQNHASTCRAIPKPNGAT